MTAAQLRELLEAAPVIAAVKDEGGLSRALDSDVAVIFALYGDIVSVGGIASRMKDAGKAAIVHLDLIDGLSPREVAVDFIREQTRADGVISTRSALCRRARAAGLLAVQRFFLLDSIALRSMEKQLAEDGADFWEVLPGVMPRVIRRVSALARRPVIAGGLISDKEDVVAALSAGAIAISSTNEDVWGL